jgi:hypothetical protein
MLADNFNNTVTASSIVLFSTFATATSASSGLPDTYGDSLLAEYTAVGKLQALNDDVVNVISLHQSADTAVLIPADIDIGKRELAAALYDVYAAISDPADIDPEILAVMPEDFSDLYI